MSALPRKADIGVSDYALVSTATITTAPRFKCGPFSCL